MTNSIVPKLPALQSPVFRYLANLRSENSRKTMLAQLNTLARLFLQNEEADAYGLAWETLTYEHTNVLASVLLEQKRSPATVNLMLSALKGVLKECWMLQLMDTDTYQRAVAIKMVPYSREPAGRELTFAEIVALVDACKRDKHLSGIRDLAIIAVLRCGLRRSEVANLAVKDFDPKTGKLMILGAKGNKDRAIYMTGNILTHVLRWCSHIGLTEGALFPPILKNGKCADRFMTAQAIYNIVFQRAIQAGVGSFSPHDFRRTFAGDMLDSGVDIVTVQKLMGHADPKTPARYDRRGDRAKQAAAKMLDFPE